MNFGKRDVQILMSMIIAVMMITYAFPAMGLADLDRQSPADAPDISIDEDTFDFAGDQPRRPASVDEVLLTIGPDSVRSDERGFLIGSIGSTEQLSADLQEVGVNQIAVTYQYLDGTNSDSASSSFNASGQREDVELDTNGDNSTDTVLVATVTEYDNSTSPITAEVSVEMKEAPGGSGFLGSVPIFGDALEGIYQTLAWLGLMFLWVSLVIVGFFVSIATTVVEIGGFVFGVLAFLVGGYGSVVSAAPGIAGVILAIPGLLLSFELAKIGFLLLDLIWFG